jgi:hypothetical protein
VYWLQKYVVKQVKKHVDTQSNNPNDCAIDPQRQGGIITSGTNLLEKLHKLSMCTIQTGCEIVWLSGPIVRALSGNHS